MTIIQAARGQAPAPPAGTGEWTSDLEVIFTKIPSLSTRESEVFWLMAEGASNRTISNRLRVTERTAKAHVGRILAKLDVESRMQAGIVAFAWCVLTQEGDEQAA